MEHPSCRMRSEATKKLISTCSTGRWNPPIPNSISYGLISITQTALYTFMHNKKGRVLIKIDEPWFQWSYVAQSASVHTQSIKCTQYHRPLPGTWLYLMVRCWSHFPRTVWITEFMGSFLGTPPHTPLIFGYAIIPGGQDYVWQRDSEGKWGTEQVMITIRKRYGWHLRATGLEHDS